MFNLFGALPDILMGRKPKDALIGNTAAVGSTLFGGNILQGLQGASAATNPALIESAMQTPGYGASSASPMGLGDMFKSAGGYIKPIGEAAGAANSVRGLLAPQQAMPMPVPMMQQQRGQDPIAGLLAQQQQLEELRRKARYGIA